jgi:hypothetical protein
MGQIPAQTAFSTESTLKPISHETDFCSMKSISPVAFPTSPASVCASRYSQVASPTTP